MCTLQGVSAKTQRWHTKKRWVDYIQQNIVPKWSLGDTEETLWELHRAGFLVCKPADNTVHFAILTDDGIVYMENRFKDGLSEVLGYIEKIKSILLW